MELLDINRELAANAYPGRGIIIGKSDNGENGIMVYFIMGRSVNSRNRVFVNDGSGIRTEAFEASKMADPSLIIYRPVRVYNEHTIVSNGDQTDTIYESLQQNKTFDAALRERRYEPDTPNFTPRISGLATVAEGLYAYRLSILKRGIDDACWRYFFEYAEPTAGVGHFLHTYDGDGQPLPPYTGEPKAVALRGNIDHLTTNLWSHLNEENRVSLFVRYIRLSDGAFKTRLVNQNTR